MQTTPKKVDKHSTLFEQQTKPKQHEEVFLQTAGFLQRSIIGLQKASVFHDICLCITQETRE